MIACDSGDSRITPLGAKLRPGITGPATLKYRLEDEYLANARTLVQGV